MATPLSQVVQVLEALWPLAFAEDWDNVGLLLEPPAPRGVTNVLLAIDLTEPVLAEAVERSAELVVAYHPPIFRGLKRVTRRTPGERVVSSAIAAGLAVYSPHTAIDAAPGGVNDYLCELLGGGESRPINQSYAKDPEQAYKLVVFVPPGNAEELKLALGAAGAGRIGDYFECSFSSPGQGSFLPGQGANPYIGSVGQREQVEELRLEMVCARKHLAAVAQALVANHPYEEPAWEVYPLAERPVANTGMGRLLRLHEPVGLSELIGRVKRGLGLSALRVARSERHQKDALISEIAVCAGAGGSLFEPLSGPELYFTGEMRHHDVLQRVSEGASVILCDHTNTERGYLPRLGSALSARLPALEVHVSQRDREPLEIC